MTGICLLCGFVTPDLDVLDAHAGTHPSDAVALERWPRQPRRVSWWWYKR